MLTFTHRGGATLYYRIHGSLSAGDLEEYYAVLADHYRTYGRLRLLAEVTDFRGYAGAAALLTFARGEVKLPFRVARYAAVANQTWLRTLIGAGGLLLPVPAIRTFRPAEWERAVRWLHARPV